MRSLMKDGSIIRYATMFALVDLLALSLSGLFVIQNPVAFQKSVVVQPVDFDTLETSYDRNNFDVRAILEAVPYQSTAMVYEVEPEAKYIKTIEQGYGNCSNMTFGLAYYLSRQQQQYMIVHLMPIDGFLQGEGHTVVNTSYMLDGKRYSGIVDVLGGGLPRNNGAFVELADLRAGNMQNVSLLTLNPRKGEGSPFYGEFLDTSVVGVIFSEDVESYFDFIGSIYIPLGSRKLEKYIYDGIAILFGKYPAVYVDTQDYGILFKDKWAVKYPSETFLMSARIMIALGFSIAFMVGVKRMKAR